MESDPAFTISIFKLTYDDLAKGDEELFKVAEQIRRLEDKIRLADLRAPSAGG
ncbi:hypothetical protein MCP1_70037 [Candidatus Terasakiella magnetica]|nr:hypothetical protein MCP1_70037 [Candidatus Terasakiella magnetica]